ncbi:MAG: outer membrane protein, partial [Flavobacterium sp.]
ISQAQLKRFSVDFSYPYSLDKDFLSENYNGWIDVGLKYRLIKTPVINIGIAFNGSLFKANEYYKINPKNIDASSYFMQPKIFLELNMKQLSKLRPYISAGYAYNLFQNDIQENGNDITITINKQGIILNTGVSYDFSNWFYLHIQYDFLKLKSINNPEIETINSNILKAGIGFRI